MPQRHGRRIPAHQPSSICGSPQGQCNTRGEGCSTVIAGKQHAHIRRKTITPAFELAFELNAQLDEAIDLGDTPAGFRRIIPILGGTFAGPNLYGTLLAGGADWQIVRPDRVTELHAHYVLKTHDGVLIQVKVRGLRHGKSLALARIAAGEQVDPSEYYFRAAPIFEAPFGSYDWLNRSLFIGVGTRQQSSVRLSFYRLL